MAPPLITALPCDGLLTWLMISPAPVSFASTLTVSYTHLTRPFLERIHLYIQITQADLGAEGQITVRELVTDAQVNKKLLATIATIKALLHVSILEPVSHVALLVVVIPAVVDHAVEIELVGGVIGTVQRQAVAPGIQRAAAAIHISIDGGI